MTRGMVISKEIIERKMGYRGSKSDDIIKYIDCKRATSGCFFIYYNNLICLIIYKRNISTLRLKIP